MRVAPLVAVLSMLAGCASPPAPAPTPYTQCPAERPQVCTMEYNPVCATLRSGGQATYSSPCNACADDQVTQYLGGACPE